MLCEAENLHYPVTNKLDLIKFLNQIDGKLLSKMTFQSDHTPGFGRKAFNRIWTVCIEGKEIPYLHNSCKFMNKSYLFPLVDHNAIEPFITQTPFDVLTNDSYQSNVDTLYSSSPKVITHILTSDL